jgi:hypothetical protein
MATLVDRANALRQKQDAFTGIDFVRVEDPCDQTILRIYLITDGTQLDPPFQVGGSPEDTALTPESFLIDSVTDPSLPRIPVVEVFADEDGSQVQFDLTVQRHYIQIRVAGPGTFARYRLRIEDPLEDIHPQSPELSTFSRIDRFFNDKVFSFKVACSDANDCVPPGPECPVEAPVDFPVDYQARDFVSLRNALLDFAAQRYPHWSLPVEADVGMMLTEVMAALGDEFSYIQDRHAREAFLETATERRSLRKKARLLDYEIHDGRSASTLLELTIDAGDDPPSSLFVRAGSRISALSESGEAVPFEVGTGLFDRVEQGDELVWREYPVREGWNASRLEPYLFDDSQACLDVGSTEIFLVDNQDGVLEDHELLVTDPESGDRPRMMLLRTDPEDLSIPARSHFVRITAIDFIVDPLPDVPVTVTRIRWDARDALPFQMDQNALKISLNVVPATAGETVTQKFAVRPEGLLADDVSIAVEREGPQKLPSVEREGTTLEVESNERPAIVLLGLPGTEAHGLGFLGSELRSTTPEIEVVEDTPQGNAWSWVRSILDALPGREVFSLEDGVWRRIRGFRKIGGEFVHRDYATGAGFTVRFGDGEFGRVPGTDSRFIVRYRTGPGARANVPAGSINVLSAAFQGSGNQWWVTSAYNPQAVTDGVDPESAREIRLLAPEAYQSDVLFALRPSDYGRQAQRLDFVQRAQGTARWTGSWPSIFVSADPFGAANLTEDQRDRLEARMDCVRQAGREVIVREPQTIGLDLVIALCIEPTAYAAHVLIQAQELMLGRGVDGRPKGFFHPDNFSFGTPLRRSALEAVLQGIPGVQSVRRIWLRQRGVQRFRLMRELVLKVGRDQILRLDNDPLRPEHGSLRFEPQGGA